MNSASLFSLAGRYDSPIPTRLQAPVDCLKIPALEISLRGDDSTNQAAFSFTICVKHVEGCIAVYFLMLLSWDGFIKIIKKNCRTSTLFELALVMHPNSNGRTQYL